MQEKNIKILSFGCRLNSLEAEKIKAMLAASAFGSGAIIVNTCAVTAEAERQSRQAVRKIARENPGAAIFITGCAATRSAADYAKIPGVAAVIPNKDKFDINAYVGALLTPPLRGSRQAERSEGKPVGGNDSRFVSPPTGAQNSAADSPAGGELTIPNLSKAFVQIQNGCNHSCSYCIVSKLRGKNVSFPYEQILNEVRTAVDNGFYEVVLTGVDIAGYMTTTPPLTGHPFAKAKGNYTELFEHDTEFQNNSIIPEKQIPLRFSEGVASRSDDGVVVKNFFLSDLCEKLLNDVPQLQRLRLSSMDPASPELPKIINLMARQPRMLPHLHLSMQSGSDEILSKMSRRHNVEIVEKLTRYASSLIPHPSSFSWDIICGFPGETPELFNETVALARQLKPIHIHAFPFSPRPGTPAATMPGQIDRTESKRRVKIINDLADENRREFMKTQVGKTVQVLVEENNVGRTPDDISVKISGAKIPARTVCDVKLVGINNDVFIGG